MNNERLRAFQERATEVLRTQAPRVRAVRLPERFRTRISSPVAAGLILLSTGVVLENQFQVADKVGTGITCVAAETVNWAHYSIHGPLQAGSDALIKIGTWAKPNPYEPIFSRPTTQPTDQ